ncbi:MAG: hypothetical protein M3463_00215 [Verrucomicrobiota bacterium]|nr:hypothetical protein [Verrucomicrobiota bacterium]
MRTILLILLFITLTLVAVAEGLPSIKNLFSPDGEYRIEYSISSGLDHLATLKHKDRTIWAYRPTPGSRGLSFSWSPSSKAALMFEHHDERDMDAWLVRVDDHVSMLHLNLRAIEWTVSESVRHRECSAASAPKSGVHVDTIKWLSPERCTMRFYHRFIGANADAELRLELDSKHPLFHIEKIIPQ